jgi:hypothetical protein
MQFRLRTLLIALAVGPVLLAGLAMGAGLLPANPVIVAAATYVGLLAALIAVAKVFEDRGHEQPGGANPYFESQVEVFDRQTKETDRLMAQHDQSMRRSDDLHARHLDHADRMEQLLDKMEEQARRKDAILDAEEKQLGMRT